MKTIAKASRCILGAFLLSPSLLFSPWALSADCRPPGRGETVQVEYVVDGDSVRLSDGRSVRLIGINTPELKPRNRPPESLAIEARQAVVNFLAADGDILFYVDQGKRDRHGRYLGHLFRRDAAGLHSLERHLLLQGLAYHVAIPPNLSMAECFAIAEDTARVYGRGLWLQANSVASREVRRGGYQRVSGVVKSVSLGKVWWINLEGGFVAVIYPENHRFFDPSAVRNWSGRRIEIEGWVYGVSKEGRRQWRVKLETPYAVNRVTDDKVFTWW